MLLYHFGLNEWFWTINNLKEAEVTNVPGALCKSILLQHICYMLLEQCGCQIFTEMLHIKGIYVNIQTSIGGICRVIEFRVIEFPLGY